MRYFLLLTVLFAAFFVHAQDEATWTIVDRCLPAPTTAPENWSYDGTILLGSEIGIRGINQDWETRRILAYRPNETQLSYLSPVGQTWLTFQGDSVCSGSCFSPDLYINSMTVHDLTLPVPSYQQIQWRFYTPYKFQNPEGDQHIPILRWLSATRFQYIKVINDDIFDYDATPIIYDLENGEIDVYETPVDATTWHNISPDGTLVIDSVFQANVIHYFLSNPQDLSPIVEFPADFYPFSYYTLNVWSPDSQYFLGAKSSDDNNGDISFWLMNRNGEALYLIANSLLSSPYLNIQWSPDGHYLLILSDRSQKSWLIDLENRHSYNLCQDKLFRAAWSPDSQQIAFQIYNWQENLYLPLTIFEPATWSAYEVADSPDATVIGWQAEEE